MRLSISVHGIIGSITGTLLLALSSAAFAASPPTAATASTPTREMREKMATLHEQMAACLRSDKSMSECRAEMQKSCQSMMGSQGCTRMMGSGGMMGRGQGMRGQMSSSPPSGGNPPK